MQYLKFRRSSYFFSLFFCRVSRNRCSPPFLSFSRACSSRRAALSLACELFLLFSFHIFYLLGRDGLPIFFYFYMMILDPASCNECCCRCPKVILSWEDRLSRWEKGAMEGGCGCVAVQREVGRWTSEGMNDGLVDRGTMHDGCVAVLQGNSRNWCGCKAGLKTVGEWVCCGAMCGG